MQSLVLGNIFHLQPAFILQIKYFLGPDEKGMPRDCPEFFGPDFAAGSGRRVLNHTGAKLLNNFSFPNLLSVRFLMHCKHSRPKNWGRKTRGNLGAFPFHPDRGSINECTAVKSFNDLRRYRVEFAVITTLPAETLTYHFTLL